MEYCSAVNKEWIIDPYNLGESWGSCAQGKKMTLQGDTLYDFILEMTTSRNRKQISHCQRSEERSVATWYSDL